MKSRLPLALSVSFVVALGSAQAVQIGDSRGAVIADLGQPSGIVAAGSTEMLVYLRGEIRLRNGTVHALRLVSDEEFAAQQAAARERAQRLVELEAEGRALHAEKKNDPALAQSSADAQLAFWRLFAARYPMVPVESELSVLQARVDLEERQRNDELRLARLEARVAEAETQAARAEQEARRARYDRHDYDFFGHFPFARSIGWRGLRPIDDCTPDHHSPSRPRIAIPVTPRGQAMGNVERARAEIYRRSIY